MQIDRVDEKEFAKWRIQIERLLNISVSINFPDCSDNEEYGARKCDELERYIKDGSAIVYAATEEDSLMGWIWAHHIERVNGKRLHIAEIAVDKSFQGKGVGKQLLKTIETYARKHHYHEIDLLVTKSNTTAVLFYTDSDFEIERLLLKKLLLDE